MPIHSFEQAKSHALYRSKKLAEALLKIVEPSRLVIDLGCGDGWYLSVLSDAGHRVLGIEATPGIQKLACIPGIIGADLRDELRLSVPEHSATVLSFEVGEHIEPEFADAFLDNLARYAKRIILSWCVPGPVPEAGADRISVLEQKAAGGHVNEQENSWVAAKMLDRGFVIDAETTGFLRKAVEDDPFGYWKTNLMALSRPRIFDCFLFYQELDMLELRLRELAPAVDRFVLVESTRTFQLQPKPLYYAENRERFAEWNDRITHVVVDELAPLESGYDQVWSQERFQRNAILRGLAEADDSDIAIIADVDEIPSRDAIRLLRGQHESELYSAAIKSTLGHAGIYLHIRLHYYWLDCISIQPDWFRLAASTVGHVRKVSPTGLRIEEYQKLPRFEMNDCGWHFSYFGGAEAVIAKRLALSESEYICSQFLDQRLVQHRIDAGLDPLDRPFPCRFIEFDDSFPETVKADPAKYARLGWFRHAPNCSEN